MSTIWNSAIWLVSHTCYLTVDYDLYHWLCVTLNASNNQRLRKTRDMLCFAQVSRDKWSKTRDQITSETRSKRGWSNCVMCIPFILTVEVQSNTGCDACVTTTWRLGLRSPLVTRTDWGQFVYFVQNYVSECFMPFMILSHKCSIVVVKVM